MDLLDYTIPVVDWVTDAGAYKSVPVDHNDLRFNDPLVCLSDFGIGCESFYARSDGCNWPYRRRIEGSLAKVWCRRLVAERLQVANAFLLAHEAEVYVLDAYRPLATQVGLWSFFWNQSADAMPGATDAQRRAYVLRYVSDPTRFQPRDPTTWPVHATGGAVDLTLRSLETGALLQMGAAFDDMQEASRSDALERALLKHEINGDHAALRNRRLLHWAMSEAGFVNYPFEYWHFDWGDQMFVHHLAKSGKDTTKKAWYGYTPLPQDQ